MELGDAAYDGFSRQVLLTHDWAPTTAKREAQLGASLIMSVVAVVVVGAGQCHGGGGVGDRTVSWWWWGSCLSLV